MSGTASSFTGFGPMSGTPYNSNDIKYYSFFKLAVSKATGSTLCGDAAGYMDYILHPSMIVTTGTSGSNYTMRIIMSTVVNTTSYSPCDIGNTYPQDRVNSINNASTGTSNNYTGTTTTGARYSNAFYYFAPLLSAYTSYYSTEVGAFYQFYNYSYNTYVYTSTTPSSIVSSLSATTCTNIPDLLLNQSSPYTLAYTYYYQMRLFNTGNTNDYQIWASPITNYVYSGYSAGIPKYELAYTFSSGTEQYYNPNYII